MEGQSATNTGSRHYPALQLLGCTALRVNPKQLPLQLQDLAPSHPHPSSPDTPPFLGCSQLPRSFLPSDLYFPTPLSCWHLLLQAGHTTSFVISFCPYLRATSSKMASVVTRCKASITDSHIFPPTLTAFTTTGNYLSTHWDIASCKSSFRVQAFSFTLNVCVCVCV